MLTIGSIWVALVVLLGGRIDRILALSAPNQHGCSSRRCPPLRATPKGELLLQSASDKSCINSATTTTQRGLDVTEPRERLAFPQQTPHSGRHFLPSHPAYSSSKGWRWRFARQKRRKRFTEGWYYRLTLPDEVSSFAFVISIEDPGHSPPSDLRLACIQVVGPDDEYLVQGDRDNTRFWAWNRQQGLGCTFNYTENVEDIEEMKQKAALSESEWKATVASGFQILPTRWLGRVRGRDGTVGTVLEGKGEGFACDFDFTVDPICGWGGTSHAEQKSTAGWLASFPIFEPHWQITLADARASGSVMWKGKTYHFKNAPFYAEKNWGASLPKKWYWTQCNAFRGYDQLSVVAGGGIREIPFGMEEALGMVSVHYNGILYEAVPWMGGMSWDVDTWGRWVLKGNSTLGDRRFAVEVTYICDPNLIPGLVFRAPTKREGLVRFCRDTFVATCELSLWELDWDETTSQNIRGRSIIEKARSSQGGAEVGGGPWWDTWREESTVKRPIRALLRLPYRISQAKKRIRMLLRIK
jgi:tocopherol cyclase